jgi:hypothetical protein
MWKLPAQTGQQLLLPLTAVSSSRWEDTSRAGSFGATLFQASPWRDASSLAFAPLRTTQQEKGYRMSNTGRIATAGGVLLLTGLLVPLARAERHSGESRTSVQLGPRPYYLVDDLPPGTLKERLQQCADGPFESTDFSIGHRGAALQFPDTKESYEAAARIGAGILECDVTFTQDRQLVCRHSQCDLHTTTNILAVPELAAKCSAPFSPADPATGTTAQA